MNAANAPRDAPPPFDKAGADIILRTSDNVDFRVFRWILEDASPVFADMFKFVLDQPPIVVSEDSETLAFLLRLYYPLPTPPSFSTFDQAKKILIAANRYRLTVAVAQVTDAAIVHIKANPLRAYAFAFSYGLEDLMCLSAMYFLAVSDIAVYLDELEDISAGAYQRLFAYRCACTAAMDQFVKNIWMPPGNDWSWMSCSSCTKYKFLVALPLWFESYWARVSAMLRSTPSPEAVKNPSLVEKALPRAYKCSSCSSKQPHQQLQAYSTLLAAEVERIVSEVSIH